MNLTEALKAVAPHTAPKNHNLPVLTHVRVKDGYALATDRYTLARAKITDHDTPDGYYTMEQVKKAPVSVTPASDTQVNDVVTYADGTQGPATEAPGDYPSVNRLIENWTPGTEIAPMVLDPKFALKFQAKHFPKNGSRVFEASMQLAPGETPTKPVKVTFPGAFTEDEFVALWVPIRIPEGQYAR